MRRTGTRAARRSRVNARCTLRSRRHDIAVSDELHVVQLRWIRTKVQAHVARATPLSQPRASTGTWSSRRQATTNVSATTSF